MTVPRFHAAMQVVNAAPAEILNIQLLQKRRRNVQSVYSPWMARQSVVVSSHLQLAKRTSKAQHENRESKATDKILEFVTFIRTNVICRIT